TRHETLRIQRTELLIKEQSLTREIEALRTPIPTTPHHSVEALTQELQACIQERLGIEFSLPLETEHRDGWFDCERAFGLQGIPKMLLDTIRLRMNSLTRTYIDCVAGRRYAAEISPDFNL